MSRSLRAKRRERKRKRVLIWKISAGVLLIAGIVFTLVQNASRINPELIEVEGRPAIKVDQELIDFGYKKWNTNLTFDFTVTNIGDKTLRFTETPFVEVLEGC